MGKDGDLKTKGKRLTVSAEYSNNFVNVIARFNRSRANRRDRVEFQSDNGQLMIDTSGRSSKNLAIDGSGLSRDESFGEIAEDSIGDTEDARIHFVLRETVEVGNVGSSDVDVLDVGCGSCELCISLAGDDVVCDVAGGSSGESEVRMQPCGETFDLSYRCVGILGRVLLDEIGGGRFVSID